MEKKTLLDKVQDVYLIIVRNLRLAEIKNTGILLFSILACSINLYMVSKSSIIVNNSKFIALWILSTILCASFIFYIMSFWATKVRLWKDKSLRNSEKKVSEKKNKSLIFYKEIASYSNANDYLKDFIDATTEEEQEKPKADKLTKDYAQEILVNARVTNRKMFIYKIHVTVFTVGFIAYICSFMLIF